MSEPQPQPGDSPAGFYIALTRVAELVGVTPTHVHRLHKAGTLLAVRHPRTKRWWVDGESVRKYLAALAHENEREGARLNAALHADEFKDEDKRLAREGRDA